MRDVARFGLVGLSTIAFLGCGGGGGGSGPAAKPGTVNMAGAVNVTQTTASLVTSLNSGDGATMSSTAVALGMSGAQQIVSPPAGSGAAVIHSAQTIAGSGGGTAECDATGCVYNNYKDSTGTNAVTMNGKIKATASGEVTTLDMDVDFDLDQQGMPAHFDLTGSLDISAAMIDGEMNCIGTAKFNAGTQNITYNWYNELKYNAVTLSNGTATGGSLYAKWGITLSGVAGAEQANQVYDGTVTFGL
jgi:hypothetical protein